MQLSELEETYRREYAGKSRDRLQAAALRKRGMVLKEITRTVWRGLAPSTGGYTGWSAKVQRAGTIPRVRAGRGYWKPRDSGFERGSWNAMMYVLPFFTNSNVFRPASLLQSTRDR